MSMVSGKLFIWQHRYRMVTVLFNQSLAAPPRTLTVPRKNWCSVSEFARLAFMTHASRVKCCAIEAPCKVRKETTEIASVHLCYCRKGAAITNLYLLIHRTVGNSKTAPIRIETQALKSD